MNSTRDAAGSEGRSVSVGVEAVRRMTDEAVEKGDGGREASSLGVSLADKRW